MQKIRDISIPQSVSVQSDLHYTRSLFLTSTSLTCSTYPSVDQ